MIAEKTQVRLGQKLFRSEDNANIGGVCAGIAMSRSWSITLVRIVALLLLTTTGIALIAYIAAWALLPKFSDEGLSEEDFSTYDPLRRSSEDRVLAGVCAGLAELLKVDVTLVRIVTVVLFCLGGVGLLPYIYAWIVLPSGVNPENQS